MGPDSIFAQWLDIFSSLSLNRVPKFLGLWKTLLDPITGCPALLNMSALTGCSEDTLLAIAEISQLANWKAMQLRNDSLSYPELIKRGKTIQDSIARHQAVHAERYLNFVRVNELHEGEPPSERHRAACISLFRESSLLYLHTVLSNSSPGESINVLEITRC